MAKKRRTYGTPSVERDPLAIANDPGSLLTTYLTPLPINTPVVRSPLSEVEDYRAFHPDRVKPSPRSVRSSYARLLERPVGRTLSLKFASPAHAVVCVRRKLRKEVLHALGRVGRGSGGKRMRRRRTDRSNIHC